MRDGGLVEHQSHCSRQPQKDRQRRTDDKTREKNSIENRQLSREGEEQDDNANEEDEKRGANLVRLHGYPQDLVCWLAAKTRWEDPPQKGGPGWWARIGWGQGWRVCYRCVMLFVGAGRG